jgi:hypothetical protein
MPKLVVTCPSCSGDLKALRLGCPSCGTQLDGSFDLPFLLQLPADDLAFVVDFVRSSGSLKAMAAKGGTSYPTVRNRLDQILAKLEQLEQGQKAQRTAILDALESGKLSAQEADAQLRKVGL